MTRLRAVALFALLATLWGLSFPAISVGLRSLDPVLFAAFRYDLAAVLLVAFAVTRTTEWWPTARNDLVAVLAGGVFMIAANGLLFIGQQTVASGVAAVMQSLVPIATTLWALGLLPEERVSAVGAVGICLAFVGVGLVVRPDPANLLAGSTRGKLLILTQVVSVSLGGVLVQRSEPTLDRAALSGWSMAVGAVALHGISVAIGEPLALPELPVAWGAILYLGVFSTAIAFFIYYTLLEVRGALETSLVSYLVPVVATIASVFILDESIKPLTLVGFAIVFCGFLLLKRRAVAEIFTGTGRTQPSD